ncbi:hypothetical protein BGP_2407 [Beggiatoa sp. PS]|nr:hypothetical protein BGP_2407 [Beggiatoa sp. PS]
MYFLNDTHEKTSLKSTFKPGAEVQNFSYSFHSIFLGPFLNFKYLKTYTFSIYYQLPITNYQLPITNYQLPNG